MRILRRAILIFFVFLCLFAGLGFATHRLFRNSAHAPPSNFISAGAAPAARAGLSDLTAVAASPQKVESRSDQPLNNGPRIIMCGTSDLEGLAWLGSENDGVWKYSDSKWQNFTYKEGLGDVDATAICCDTLGRIWVGHSRRGLSIYNGKEWHCYDRLSGLGGSRIYCIKTCPTDGDVWLATEAGLTRYSLKNDSWTHYDRSDGMPASQASSIAFDSRGDIYLGLQADGIAVARAIDHYSNWTHFIGPDATPVRLSSSGLPSNLINAMLVTRDDRIYAGTDRGLVCSQDHGNTWSYSRGRNWSLLAQGRYEGMPDDFDWSESGLLSEDHITTLVQDPAGVIWIGYQDKGYQAILPNSAGVDASGKGNITAIVPSTDGLYVMGQYKGGPFACGTRYTGPAAGTTTALPSALPADAFPSNASPPTLSDLDAMRKKFESLPPAEDGLEFIGEDWESSGNWTGRFGARLADVSGYKVYHAEPGYTVHYATGPYRKASVNGGFDYAEPDQEGGTFGPDLTDHKRVFNEWNDNSYQLGRYPIAQEGPDIFAKVTVPAGVHLISIYFDNRDPHDSLTNAHRDYVVEARHVDGDEDDDPEDNNRYGGRFTPLDTVDAELSPIIVRTRVVQFYRGVYKRFLIRGAGSYWFKVNRNHSECTKICGVMIDRLDDDSAYKPQWCKASFIAPKPTDYTADPGPKGAVARLWAAIDASSGKAGYATLVDRARLMAYSAAVANGIDDETLTCWRTKLGLWTAADHDRFDAAAGIAEPGGL